MQPNQESKEAEPNQIGRVKLRTTVSQHDSSEKNRTNGSFVLIDDTIGVVCWARMINSRPEAPALTTPLRRLIARYRRLGTAAGIRIGGAALVVLGTVVGIRTLGANQFGVSVLAMSAGQIVALPAVALERLVLRLAATGQAKATHTVLRLSNWYSLALGATTAGACALVYPMHHSWAAFVLAAGLTAIMQNVVVPRQGLNRAAGRLTWAQAPNELVRPIATIAGFVVFMVVDAGDSAGSLATLIASAVTLLVGLLAPTSLSATTISHRHGDEADATAPALLRTAATSLLVIAIMAAVVERAYPLLVGGLGSANDVAALAVGMRVMQLGLFGQAFAMFMLSPPLAVAMAGRRDFPVAVRMTRIIRLIGIATTAPIVVACLVWPHLVEDLVGGSLRIGILLTITAVATTINTFTGPTQTVLIMAGDESTVAMAYTVGAIVGLGAFLTFGDGSSEWAMGAIALTQFLWGVGMLVRSRTLYGKFL